MRKLLLAVCLCALPASAQVIIPGTGGGQVIPPAGTKTPVVPGQCSGTDKVTGVTATGSLVCNADLGASPLTTKGDIYVFGAADARLPVGTDAQCLTADSTQSLGLKWAACGAGGGGDSITVAAIAATDPDFIDTATIDFVLDTGATPDTIAANIKSASVTDAMLASNYSGVGSCTNQAVTATNDNAAPTCTTITSAFTSGTFPATPAGSDTQIQWNSGGTALGADADLTFATSNNRLRLGTTQAGEILGKQTISLPDADMSVPTHQAGLAINAFASATTARSVNGLWLFCQGLLDSCIGVSQRGAQANGFLMDVSPDVNLGGSAVYGLTLRGQDNFLPDHDYWTPTIRTVNNLSNRAPEIFTSSTGAFIVKGGTVWLKGGDSGERRTVVAAPTGQTSAIVAGSSLLAAGHYRFKVAALNDVGEGLPSTATTDLTIAANEVIRVTWNKVSGARAYKVYAAFNASADPGTANSSYTLQAFHTASNTKLVRVLVEDDAGDGVGTATFDLRTEFASGGSPNNWSDGQTTTLNPRDADMSAPYYLRASFNTGTGEQPLSDTFNANFDGKWLFNPANTAGDAFDFRYAATTNITSFLKIRDGSNTWLLFDKTVGGGSLQVGNTTSIADIRLRASGGGQNLIISGATGAASPSIQTASGNIRLQDFDVTSGTVLGTNTALNLWQSAVADGDADGAFRLDTSNLWGVGNILFQVWNQGNHKFSILGNGDFVVEGATNDAAETRFQITDCTDTAADCLVTIPNAESTTVQSDAGAANNFLTAISSSGVISKAQPSFANLSGTADPDQLGGGTAADDKALIADSASASTWRAVPDCNTNNMLTYTASTNTFGCDPDDGAGGGAPVGAQYVVGASDATLTAEKILTDGQGIDTVITGTDAGAATIDLAYTSSLAGDPAFDLGEAVFTDDCTGGGFLSEGTVANTNETRYCFPAVDTIDLSNFIVVDNTEVQSVDGDGLVISSAILAVNFGTSLTTVSDVLGFNYSSTLGGNPALNAEECIFTTDGAGGGGLLCEGTAGNVNEQLFLFPATDGADTTNFIAVDATSVTNLDGTGLAINSNQLDVQAGTGLVANADNLAFDFSDAGADPALGAGEARFSNEGASAAGLVFEGDTADTFETRLRVTDPTAERIATIPNADSAMGQAITCSGTDKVSAFSASTGAFTCTADVSGGSPTLDSVADPVAVVDFVMDATAETVTFQSTAAFTTGPQYLFQQVTGNPTGEGGGFFEIRSADVDVDLLFRLDQTADAPVIMVLDSGSTAGQGQEIRFNDRDTSRWIARNQSNNNFVFVDQQASGTPLRLVFATGGNSEYWGGSATADHRFLQSDGTTLLATINDNGTVCPGGTNDACIGRAAANVLDGTNDTWNNLDFDVEATGNDITTVSEVQFEAAGCQEGTAFLNGNAPSGNADTAPTEACNDSGSIQQPTASYAGGAVNSMEFRLRLPADWASGENVDITLTYVTTAASPTGNVEWEISTVCRASGESWDASFNAAQTITDAVGSQNNLNDATQTAVTMTGCAANEQMSIRIGRDGTNDTNGDAALLLYVQVILRRTQ